MEEIWKAVNIEEGLYSDRYEVSTFGRVKSLPHPINFKGRVVMSKERILKPIIRGLYPSVTLSKGMARKSIEIHRLIENKLNKPCVNHKDSDKTNNKVENLEWCTQAENNLHAYRVGGRKPVKGMAWKSGALYPHKVRLKGELNPNYGKFGKNHPAYGHKGAATGLRGKDAPSYGNRSCSQYILDVNTGVFYNSIKELALLIGVDRSYLAKKIRGSKPNNTPYVKA